VGIHLTLMGLAGALLMMAILSFALTALGFCIAWRMTSTQGFHAIMNLFLMPMWFLSGALFPPSGAARVVRVVMLANPLTYGLAGLREAMYWGNPSTVPPGPDFALCVIISGAFCAALFLLASVIATKRVSADLV
jgi:ABC-2 type transport system permease protein